MAPLRSLHSGQLGGILDRQAGLFADGADAGAEDLAPEAAAFPGEAVG